MGGVHARDAAVAPDGSRALGPGTSRGANGLGLDTGTAAPATDGGPSAGPGFTDSKKASPAPARVPHYTPLQARVIPAGPACAGANQK